MEVAAFLIVVIKYCVLTLNMRLLWMMLRYRHASAAVYVDYRRHLRSRRLLLRGASALPAHGLLLGLLVLLLLDLVLGY